MLSICTPSFNRAHTLHRLYKSLQSQTVKDFEWIIIDDGSTDNTKLIVENFKNNPDFPIRYYYQSNQGKHIALNKGQQLANRKLFTCVDSDDWLSADAVEIILKKYIYIKSEDDIAGMIFLDQYISGEIIGSYLPEEKQINWLDLIYKYKMNGDKFYIFKTDIIKQYEFISFPNNNHMPPSYQYYLISEHYDLYSFNIPLKIVEYMEDGISQNIVKKYFSAPENYSYYRKKIHRLIPKRILKLKNSIHFNITQAISSQNIAKNYSISFSQKLSNIITFPIGQLLYLYLLVKKRW